MESSFLVILSFLLLQSFGFGSSSMMITSSSNVTCIELERQSLIAIKQSLTDEHNRLSTWRGVECCECQGVGCDGQNGHVVKLDLRTTNYVNYLKGELSPLLRNLKHLRYLDLSGNDFLGNIPEFLGMFECLEYLNLSRSGFDGVVPHHLGNLSNLQYLDLGNFLVADDYHRIRKGWVQEEKTPIIDDLGWVSSLSSLRYLDLSGITIGHIDWYHPINMLPSLLTLKLALSGINNLHSVKHVNFTSLNSLNLSFNLINSTIHVWLSNLTDLMHLNLNDNHFHGEIPDYFGMFSALVSIDLSSNSFETSIPDSIFNLSSLVHLDLSYNKFSSPIPTRLGLLSRLEELYLQDNQLSGNIPTSLGQLSKLKNLHLSPNLLSGVVSETHFTRLTNLIELGLSSNRLAFIFSSRWVPPFQLQTFYASSCKMGPRFPNWLQTQTNLQRLNLSNSGIKDRIPDWFENIMSHIIHLDLSNNQINGHLTLFNGDSSNHIRAQKMNSTKLEGSLVSFSETRKNPDFLETVSQEVLNPRLEVVILSRNRFKGSIPTQLCKVHNIRVLDLSYNNFSGRLPGCLGNLNNLVVIDVSDNTISGIVPSSLGSLNSLRSFHLKNNRFEGDIPLSLQNLTNLVTMDLGNNLFIGNIPFWIGEKLLELTYLNLESNKFTSKIPLQLCQLSVLRYLNLAHNNITGSIPHCFRNLSGMMKTTLEFFYLYYPDYEYEENMLATMKGRQLLYTKTLDFLTFLDLSCNNIVGEIPDALMNLMGLTSLNLSGNQLHGRIPMNIGDLKQLESLDLSINKLSGRIPQSLASLNYLSHLNLSFNSLSGPIPIGSQMQTLDDLSIYEGNTGLCGPLVSRSCNENNVPYNQVDEDEGQDDSEGLWFYAGMGPGFVIGLLGLLGSLHFIKGWRVTYFEMLKNVGGWVMVLILVNLVRLRRKISA